MKITKKETKKLVDFVKDVHEDIINESGGHSKEFNYEGILYNSAYKILNYWNKNFGKPGKIGSYVYRTLATEQIFIDGNKRTAHIMAKAIMIIEGLHFKPKYKHAVEFIIKIADKKKTRKEIEQWIMGNSHIFKIEDDIDKFRESIGNYIKDLAKDLMDSD